MRWPAFKSREFVLFTAGNFSALAALWINRTVAGWLGWELTGLASWVGFVSFLLFAPAIVASPAFGVILDRADLRRAAIVSQLVMIAAMALLLVLLLTDLLTIWFVCFVALVVGVTSAADRTIRFLLVPGIVDKAALANAVTIHGISFNAARLIGPAIGGVMLAAVGADVTVAINILMFVPFLAMLFTITLKERQSPKTARQPFLAEVLDGARYAWRHPIIREGVLLTALYSLTVRGALDILPAIADGEYHRGAEGLGQMLAAAGAGALAAAIFVAFRHSGTSRSGISLAPYVSVGVGIVGTGVLGLIHDWPAALATVGVLGFCTSACAIDLQTAVQLAVSEAYRGRIMGIWIMLVIGGAAMNAIVLGFIADIYGMPGTLVGAALVGAACFPLGVVCALRWRKEALPGA
jgi:MFS family permease